MNFAYSKKDTEFGLLNECSFLDKLKTKFDTTIEQSKCKVCPYDFSSDKYIIELKTRRNTKTQYPTTMIGLNKINKLQQHNKTILLCFRFTDVDSYYEYNPNDTLEIKKGGRWDRGKTEINDYVYIPIELLTDF